MEWWNLFNEVNMIRPLTIEIEYNKQRRKWGATLETRAGYIIFDEWYSSNYEDLEKKLYTELKEYILNDSELKEYCSFSELFN